MPIARSGNPTTYEAIRSQTDLYVEYADGEREYHDLKSDPDELHNTFASLSSSQKAALHNMLTDTVNCHSEKECRTAQSGTPK
jgi:N-acetylglucosamine-6-sulfatase